VAAGAIYRHEAFYRSAETGRLEPKFLVLLATLPSNDLVARLLTSRSHGRPETPNCYQGRPYASFYIGVLGGLLHTKSWVDLRYLDDFDGIESNRRLGGGRIRPVTSLSQEVLVRLLDCVTLGGAPTAPPTSPTPQSHKSPQQCGKGCPR
jgi:hypothetical protein